MKIFYLVLFILLFSLIPIKIFAFESGNYLTDEENISYSCTSTELMFMDFRALTSFEITWVWNTDGVDHWDLEDNDDPFLHLVASEFSGGIAYPLKDLALFEENPGASTTEYFSAGSVYRVFLLNGYTILSASSTEEQIIEHYVFKFDEEDFDLEIDDIVIYSIFNEVQYVDDEEKFIAGCSYPIPSIYDDYWNCEANGYCWTWWPEGIYPVPTGGGTCAECEEDMCGVDWYSCPACETEADCELTEMCSWNSTSSICQLTGRYDCGDWSNCQFCMSEATCTSTEETTCYWEGGVCKWDWYIPPLDEELSTIWGLRQPVIDLLDNLKSKFPFSWFFEIKDIWDEKILELEVAEAVDPISIVWTMPTSTITAFSERELKIFDLKGANDQYGSQIAFFRTILTYVIWLSGFMIIFGKTRRFFSDLGD